MTLNANPLLLGDDGGFSVSRSLRMRSSASAYLSRTPATASNRKTFTWSGWVKRGALSTTSTLFSAGLVSSTYIYSRLYFDSNNNLVFINYPDTASIQATTAGVFRDPAAWYHIACAVDTTQATNSNGVKIWINGVQQTLTFAAYTQNADTMFNTTSYTDWVGKFVTGAATDYFDGYMAEVVFIDGQALDPSSFGAFSPYNQWLPKKYSGTYGTNGFYLPFTNNASAATLGNDFSGNGNTWTTNNISVTTGSTYDSTTDVPTLTSAVSSNYAVLNPNYTGRSTLTNGNLTASGTTDLPTIVPESGTYYFEIDGVSKTWTPPAAFPSAAGSYNFGQQPFVNTPTAQRLNSFNLASSSVPDGRVAMAATLWTGDATTNRTINNAVNGVSFQPDLVWTKGRNATWQNFLQDSIRGAANFLISDTTGAEATTSPNIVSSFASNGFVVQNNGNSNNTGSTYVGWQWKAGGTPASNTAGSITSSVSANVTAGFSVVTYTGTGSNATVGHGLGVAPSMVIVKQRNVTLNYFTIYHASIGNTVALQFTTSAQISAPTVWNNTSPTSSVFTVGTDSTINGSTSTYVAYCFAPVSGYSAFGSYTGNGSADGPFVYTNFRPRYVMIKRTDSAGSWKIHDTSRDLINPTGNTLYTQNSNAEAVADVFYDIVSNGFKLRDANGDHNASGGTYIYMAFAENPFKYANAR